MEIAGEPFNRANYNKIRKCYSRNAKSVFWNFVEHIVTSCGVWVKGATEANLLTELKTE